MNREELTQKLANIPFFQTFSQGERDMLLHLECLVEYGPEECLIYQHGFDKTLFYLIDGAVRVIKEDQPDAPLTTIVEPGTPFGELAFLARQFRSANVIANIPTLVIRLDEETFKQLPLAMQNKIKIATTRKIMSNRELINRLIAK